MGQLEDCLKAGMIIVFWSSDPSRPARPMRLRGHRAVGAAAGIHGALDRTNTTANWLGGSGRACSGHERGAGSDAIAYVWVTEDLYDKDYVAARTTGFDQYRAYLLGEEDGVAKSPEWQAAETGVAPRIVRALAREWGTKRTYLSCGGKGVAFGGANRSATGAQWARSMVCLMAMRGLGKPGVNFGNLSTGAPLDMEFYFPGYADGGISGDVEGTADAVQNYQRMPHLISMNSVTQKVSRLRSGGAHAGRRPRPTALAEGSSAFPIRHRASRIA
jgi:trimethylamine-N-oxide reductase (cytochrome c)